MKISTPDYDNAGDATVGIKAAGIQGPNRILISEDSDTNVLIGNSKAIRFVAVDQPPKADIVDIAPDPRNLAVDQVTLRFTEAVSGLDLGDLQLTRDGGPNLLTFDQTLNTFDDVTYTLDNLLSLTALAGTYTLKLTAAGSAILDSTGNDLPSDVLEQFVVELTPP